MAAGLGFHLCRVDVRSAVCWWDSRPATACDGVAHVLAAAEVAGQSSPVLQVSDAVLDADAS